MALTVQRDLEAVVTGFLGWLADRRGAEAVAESVVRPTDGWSSETVLVHALVDGAAEGHAVRLAPVGEGIFPTYDLGLQARAQTAAAARGSPPRRPPRWSTS